MMDNVCVADVVPLPSSSRSPLCNHALNLGVSLLLPPDVRRQANGCDDYVHCRVRVVFLWTVLLSPGLVEESREKIWELVIFAFRMFDCEVIFLEEQGPPCQFGIRFSYVVEPGECPVVGVYCKFIVFKVVAEASYCPNYGQGFELIREVVLFYCFSEELAYATILRLPSSS